MRAQIESSNPANICSLASSANDREVMDQPNQWCPESSQPEPDHQDDFAYMYLQQEHAGMQQQFQDDTPIMAPNNLTFPRDPQNTSGFERIGNASALSNLPFGGAVAVKTEQGQPSSSSMLLSFGGGLPAASTLNFAGEEGVAQEPVARRRSQLSTEEHVAAERKRREKMQQQFVALATMVPDLTKTDKISILGSTIQYVKHLEEKVKTLEKQSGRRISSANNRQHTASGPSGNAHGDGGSIPTVEASIHDDTFLLKICCERRSGVLVMIISELERIGFFIINTSVFPFSDSYFSINITAKIGDSFSAIDELVNNVRTALRDFS